MMDKMMHKMSTKHLKIGVAAAVVVKIFGLGKTLMLLAGGVGGYLLALKMHECDCDCEKDDDQMDFDGYDYE